ncbi:MAG: hypothetical protein VKI63_08240 [Cyanobium sp.]|nr:hypothetical protein [Cyanobium sp.]
MSLTPRKALRRAVTTHARAASLAALLPLMGSLAFTSPAKAGPPSCQAIDASSILSSTAPGGGCSQVINPGDTFSIDFSDLFTNPATSGNFSVNNTYSLQVANIGNGTLDFEDVQLLVSGSFDMGMTTIPVSDAAVSIWTESTGNPFVPPNPSTAPTGQGVTNYSTGSLGIGINGLPPASNTANFSLSSPLGGWPPFGVPAGLINTYAINLAIAGVTDFTGARITGKLKSTSSPGSFSAGLGIFTTNDPATQAPNFVYGNAFNVPGPLPIVGAGAAFGWSRRLRRRVKKASTVASVA